MGLRPVQSLSACTRVQFNFTFTFTFTPKFIHKRAMLQS